MCSSDLGFTRCTDCDLDLVEALPDPGNSRSPQYDRPDRAPRVYFLAWFLPLMAFVGLYVIISVRPAIVGSPLFAIPFALLILIHNLGVLWMMYHAIRYEQRVARYFILSFVPFMFIWYRLVRYPLRRELPRLL